MAKIYYDSDCDLKLLDGKVIGVIGYGSQGHAQAQNLRDSGCQVIVAELEGTDNWNKAIEDGFKPVSAAELAAQADVIVMLAPDELQRSIYQQFVVKELKPGNLLMFAHGFNIHFEQIKPTAEVDVAMVAPKGSGHTVRRQYELGDTAEYGDYVSGPRIVTPAVKQEMKRLLTAIQDGSFAP